MKRAFVPLPTAVSRKQSALTPERIPGTLGLSRLQAAGNMAAKPALINSSRHVPDIVIPCPKVRRELPQDRDVTVDSCAAKGPKSFFSKNHPADVRPAPVDVSEALLICQPVTLAERIPLLIDTPVLCR